MEICITKFKKHFELSNEMTVDKTNFLNLQKFLKYNSWNQFKEGVFPNLKSHHKQPAHLVMLKMLFGIKFKRKPFKKRIHFSVCLKRLRKWSFCSTKIKIKTLSEKKKYQDGIFNEEKLRNNTVAETPYHNYRTGVLLMFLRFY